METIPAGWCVTFKFRDDHPEFLTVYVEKQQLKPRDDPDHAGNPPGNPPRNPPKPKGRRPPEHDYLGPDDIPRPETSPTSSASPGTPDGIELPTASTDKPRRSKKKDKKNKAKEKVHPGQMRKPEDDPKGKVEAPGDAKNKAPPKLDDEGSRFKEKAMKLVRTHVLLVNEDVNVKGMTKALRETKVPEWKGEVSQLQDQIPGFRCLERNDYNHQLIQLHPKLNIQ
ncbi:Gyltl1b [Symbiodinium necroappetens]|uniref:Gyltl1b protein n=1 Tax=Symbiodinium necroappetens TaxID=1628268 RepID=A0A812ZUL3_9DINO|nr:Gyltl1b [Symbiodinium necroappetens]